MSLPAMAQGLSSFLVDGATNNVMTVSEINNKFDYIYRWIQNSTALYKVLRMVPETSQQLVFLREVEHKGTELQVGNWSTRHCHSVWKTFVSNFLV